MSRILLLLLPAALTALAHAAEPGLVLRFGEGGDARVVREAALYVPKGDAPSAFTAPGKVQATFAGILNLSARSRLVFTLEGKGSATLKIDGEVLCDAIGTPSESERLRSGEHTIEIAYTGPADGPAQLRLFWEGRDFGKEPVPASAFTHDPADPLLAKQSQLRLGHQLIADHGCASCHGDAGNTSAPSLQNARERFDTTWLAHWILDPKAHRSTARMPKLLDGETAQQDASDIAAFLGQAGVIPGETPPSGDAAIKRGGTIFHEQGCVGCHTLDAGGDAGRIGLGDIGRKYRPYALAAFLREPGKHHANTRMPDFGFDKAESEALEAFLRSLAKSDPSFGRIGDAERGERLFKQTGCINCHAGAGDFKTELPSPQPIADLKSARCTTAEYAFDATEQAAITAALAAPEPHPVPAEFAAHQFTALRCAACHSRDSQPAYRDLFAAEVAHLQPPAPAVDEEKPGAHGAVIPPLNHLGFKLLPAWRQRLLAGEITPKTRHWLPARMPAFPHRAAELSAGFSHAAGLPAIEPEPPAPDPEKVKVGADLSGLTGLSCGACHAIGDKPAFAVFEGEGTNFRDAGARLRAEYFHLWMNDPARQWPGTIMPKYATDGQTPLTQHYDGDAEKQFEAVRQYLQSLSK